MRRLKALFLTIVAIAGAIAFQSSSALAVVSTVYTQDFSGATFPPTGWSMTSGWLRATYGMGGANGSAAANNWGYANGNLSSPTFDVRTWAGSSDVLTVEFDLYFDYDYWDAAYGNDQLAVYAVSGTAGSTLLKTLVASTDYSFSEPGNTANNSPYSSSTYATSTYWKHVTLSIPLNQRVADLHIEWRTSSVGGGPDQCIDNVVITGNHFATIDFAPVSMNFGKALVGDTTNSNCFTLKNINSIPISVSNFTITGTNASDFQIVGTKPTVVPAGTTALPGTATVCVRYLPQDSGLRIAALTFNSGGDGQATVNLTLTGTGTRPTIVATTLTHQPITSLFNKTKVRLGQSMTQSFLVMNPGAGKVKVSPSTFLGGDYPGQYSVVRIPQSALLQGQSDTVTIRFTPTIEGLHSALLNVVSNANPTIQLALRGVGVLPHLMVAPSPLFFDSVAVGDTECRMITLYNPGTDTLAIFKNYFTSADADFSIHALSGTDTLVAPNDSVMVMVCFSPVRSGTREARFRLTNNIPPTFETPSRDTSIFVVNIMGTGVAYGTLSASGMTGLDSVLINTEDCREFSLKNTGGADLTLTSVAINGADSADFTLQSVALPLTIPVGATHTATVCVKPTARLMRNATLTLNGTSSDHPISLTVPLQAYGLEACGSAAPGSLFTNLTPIHSNDTESVTVTNCGDVAVTYSASLPNNCDAYKILGPAASASIAPGATTTFNVVFAPSSSGPDSCRLIVNGNVTGTTNMIAPASVALAGTGACAMIANDQFQAPTVAAGESENIDITIHNNGNLDWTPGIPTVTPSTAFTFVSVSQPTIAAGGSATATFKYAPTATGRSTATVTFPNATGAQCSEYTLSLQGNAIANGVNHSDALEGFALEQNYPNPFNPTTEIGFTVPRDAKVTLTITDLKGVTMKTLIDDRVSAGHHVVELDASSLPSGAYYYTLVSGATRVTKQMVVSK